jgi:hypothetical protein
MVNQMLYKMLYIGPFHRRLYTYEHKAKNLSNTINEIRDLAYQECPATRLQTGKLLPTLLPHCGLERQHTVHNLTILGALLNSNNLS